MLVAHARGLGSCWVGAPNPWLWSPGVARELGVPVGYVPDVAIVLGYSDEAPAGNPRPLIHWSEGPDAASVRPST